MKNWQNFEVPKEALSTRSCSWCWSTDYCKELKEKEYKYSDGTFPRMRISQVSWIRRPSTSCIIDVVGVDYYFGQVSILTKILWRFENVFSSDFRCNTDHIDQCLLYYSQICQLLDFLFGESTDLDLISALRRYETEAFEVFHTSTIKFKGLQIQITYQ